MTCKPLATPAKPPPGPFQIFTAYGRLLGTVADLQHAQDCCDLWFNAAIVMDGMDVVYRKYGAPAPAAQG